MLLERKKDMRELAQMLRKELKVFEAYGLDQEVESEIFAPLQKRLNGMPLRAYFVQKTFQIIHSKLTWNKKAQLTVSRKSPVFLVKIPFIFELIITIQYLHNQILDKKDGVDSIEKISRNLLTANLLKDYLYQYINDQFSGNFQKKLFNTVRKAFAYVDIGQMLEKRHNNYAAFSKAEYMGDYSFSKEIDTFISFEGMEVFMESLQKDLPREKWEFTELYLKRMYLTCAALFKLSTLFLCDVLNVPNKEKKELVNFAATYGLMRQLINDNADFVPSSYGLSTLSKSTEDAFSDLKNRNITLPLIFHLSESPNSTIKQWLVNDKEALNLQMQQSFSKELMHSHAIFKSIQQSRLLSVIANSYLQTKPCKAKNLLADTCQIAWWNKFLFAFVKTTAYKGFKKTPYYSKMKKIMKGHQYDEVLEETFTKEKWIYTTEKKWLLILD